MKLDRRKFLGLLTCFLSMSSVVFADEETAWAGWVDGKFRRNLNMEDPALRGRVMWLVVADGGFPPGWLDGYERETARLFEPRRVWLPIIEKGS